MRISPAAALCLTALTSGAQAGSIIFATNATTADAAYVTFLQDLGHTVSVRTDLGTLDATKIGELNAADLIIFSRNTTSGDFAGVGEPTQWNSITTPLLLHNALLVRNTQWSWINNASGSSNASLTSLDVTTAGVAHPIFEDATGELFATAQNVAFNPATTAGNGTLLAAGPAGVVGVAEWQAGRPFFTGSTETPAGLRVLFSLGPSSGSNLEYFAPLTDNGKDLLANTVEYMIPEPSSTALLSLGLIALCRRRRA